uniref:Uncharacterized protein n=1 Tax=Rousettus aegyptiacus TaxID=9407 RepID=A0A7J8CI57_ROUAE|nr:hypothetical protein HJG63_009023 [Rousettus aegyptiacus]
MSGLGGPGPSIPEALCLVKAEEFQQLRCTLVRGLQARCVELVILPTSWMFISGSAQKSHISFWNRDQERAADTGNCEYSVVFLLRLSDPLFLPSVLSCPASPLSLSFPVSFPRGSLPELILSALSTILHF